MNIILSLLFPPKMEQLPYLKSELEALGQDKSLPLDNHRPLTHWEEGVVPPLSTTLAHYRQDVKEEYHA